MFIYNKCNTKFLSLSDHNITKTKNKIFISGIRQRYNHIAINKRYEHDRLQYIMAD